MSVLYKTEPMHGWFLDITLPKPCHHLSSPLQALVEDLCSNADEYNFLAYSADVRTTSLSSREDQLKMNSFYFDTSFQMAVQIQIHHSIRTDMGEDHRASPLQVVEEDS